MRCFIPKHFLIDDRCIHSKISHSTNQENTKREGPLLTKSKETFRQDRVLRFRGKGADAAEGRVKVDSGQSIDPGRRRHRRRGASTVQLAHVVFDNSHSGNTNAGDWLIALPSLSHLRISHQKTPFLCLIYIFGG